MCHDRSLKWLCVTLLGISCIVYCDAWGKKGPTRSRNTRAGKLFAYWPPTNTLPLLGGHQDLSVGLAVIGGHPTQPSQYPWQVSLQVEFQGRLYHTCGGSLLSTTCILTASHCCQGSDPSSMYAVAGLSDLTNLVNSQTSEVSSFVTHELFNMEDDKASIANDIAIVKVKKPFTLNKYVKLSTLPPNDSDSLVGKNCVICGFGRYSSSAQLSSTLQQANMGVISQTSCKQLLKVVRGTSVWDKQLCIFDIKRRSGSCNGDSGGSLNCPDRKGGYYVAGVTSWGVTKRLDNGDSECLTAYPSIYTKVSGYLTWISQHMEDTP